MIALHKRNGTMGELTPKQNIFVATYVAKPNATKAAIIAGYSNKTAYSQGQRLLKNVEIQAAVDAGLKEKIESIKLVGVKLIKAIEEIALDASNPKSNNYNGHVALKAIFYLGREQQMKFATEQHEVVSHGDIAQDIADGRERARRAGARVGKKTKD